MTSPCPVDLEVADLDGWKFVAAGGERKLERFGDHLIERPAPQAIWPDDGQSPWADAAAVFNRSKDGSGKWNTRATEMVSWKVSISPLVLDIRLTGFGNLGFFPEHTTHWHWLTQTLSGEKTPSVLNLFAYTGGASLICAKAGATVTHVDAARSVNAWARDNASLSGIKDGAIRFLADDALKFVRREKRRGHRYHGIILDPPTFGRGPKGETWKIERDLHNLTSECFSLLEDTPLFVLATSHSPGVTPAVLRALFDMYGGNKQSGEMLLKGQGPSLPAGAYLRWTP